MTKHNNVTDEIMTLTQGELTEMVTCLYRSLTNMTQSPTVAILALNRTTEHILRVTVGPEEAERFGAFFQAFINSKPESVQ